MLPSISWSVTPDAGQRQNVLVHWIVWRSVKKPVTLDTYVRNCLMEREIQGVMGFQEFFAVDTDFCASLFRTARGRPMRDVRWNYCCTCRNSAQNRNVVGSLDESTSLLAGIVCAKPA